MADKDAKWAIMAVRTLSGRYGCKDAKWAVIARYWQLLLALPLLARYWPCISRNGPLSPLIRYKVRVAGLARLRVPGAGSRAGAFKGTGYGYPGWRI